MPTIARLNGVTIKMYFMHSEHNPPHVHAIHGGSAAALDISTGEIMDGALSLKDYGYVKNWILENTDLLQEMWTTQRFRKIDT